MFLVDEHTHSQAACYSTRAVSQVLPALPFALPLLYQFRQLFLMLYGIIRECVIRIQSLVCVVQNCIAAEQLEGADSTTLFSVDQVPLFMLYKSLITFCWIAVGVPRARSILFLKAQANVSNFFYFRNVNVLWCKRGTESLCNSFGRWFPPAGCALVAAGALVSLSIRLAHSCPQCFRKL